MAEKPCTSAQKLISSQRRGQVERILFGAVRTYCELLRRSDKAMRGEYRTRNWRWTSRLRPHGYFSFSAAHQTRALDPDRLAEQLLRLYWGNEFEQSPSVFDLRPC